MSTLTSIFSLQQSGGAIVMDAEATAALHKKGVAATDDSFKFTWFKVNSYELCCYIHHHIYFCY